MLSYLISRMIIVSFGVLYPGYKSYKALNKKDIKEIIRILMYWVAFAGFSCVETVADIFVSWFPFYYEIKILFIIWLSAPYFQGSSILYRKLIYPNLKKKEKEIDQALEVAAEKGYNKFFEFGNKGIQFLVSTAMTTALKGHDILYDQLKNKSGSMIDLRSAQAAEMHHYGTRPIRDAPSLPRRRPNAPNRVIDENEELPPTSAK